MAEATFTPAAPPGFAASSFVNGLGQGQSLMLRAQQARMQQEEFQRQQELHQAMMPSLLAKAQADTATAQATIQNFNQVQGLRQRFASEAPIAQKEFEDAMSLADYGAQSDELGKLQQKYSWMQLLPEGKPFAEGLSNMRLQAHQSWQLDQHLQTQKDVAQIRGDNLLNGIAARGDETRQTNADAGKGVPIQTKWLQAMHDAEDNGDEETASFYRNRLIKDSTNNPGLDQSERVRRLQTAIQTARATGNTAAEQQYQQALDKYLAPTHSNNNDAFFKALGIAPTTGTPAPAASAPASAAPVAPSVAPTAAATANPRVPVAPPPRAYVQDPKTGSITLSPSVRTPQDTLAAYQQIIEDHPELEAQVRAQLEKLGFKKKGK